MCSIREFSAFYSHFKVTCGQMTSLPSHFRSPEVRWGNFLSGDWLPPPASYSLVRSEMYCIRKFSAFYSHFQVTSGQMTSLPVTSGHLRSCDVISCHMTASYCELQPCKWWNEQYTWVVGSEMNSLCEFLAFYSHLYWLPSNDITSGSLQSAEATWRHFLSRDSLLLRATSL